MSHGCKDKESYLLLCSLKSKFKNQNSKKLLSERRIIVIIIFLITREIGAQINQYECLRQKTPTGF
jgi:hypothetical protein